MFEAGAPVILPSGAAVTFTAGVPTGADVSLTGITVVLVAVAAAVAGVVDDDELVHPAIRTMPITKTAIASAIPSFRFRTGLFFWEKKIKLIRVHLWFKIICIYILYRSARLMILWSIAFLTLLLLFHGDCAIQALWQGDAEVGVLKEGIIIHQQQPDRTGRINELN